MENVRIALVQMQSLVGETERNLHIMENFLAEAKTKGVNIICFPELAIQGYTKKSAAKLAEKIPGSISDLLLEWAKANNITILTGIIEKSYCEKPYITQLICTEQGEIFKYRKTHLGLREKSFFISSNSLPVFKTKEASFAIQLCLEMHFPEISTIYALNGAEIIFAPHASPIIIGNRRDIWLKYMTARAYDNSAFVASCNLIGDNGEGIKFGGGCLVIDPKGEIIAEDFRGKEGMLIVDLSSKEINMIRYQKRESMKNTFYLHYRRPELYDQLVK